MYRFLLKSSIFLSACLIFSVFVFFQADGHTDPFYLKVSSGKKTSLVLGTSRAAQGILPSILEEELDKDIFNFAFTVLHSPYGEVYFRSITKKVQSNTKNGVFILSVDPWSISSGTRDPNDTIKFREKRHFLGALEGVTQNPNLEYLLRFRQNPFFDTFVSDNTKVLHKDGWLEINIERDSIAFIKRLNEKIAYNTRKLETYKFSLERLDKLRQTINFLKMHGEVYLVYLPIHPKVKKVDDRLIPDFTTKMIELGKVEDVPFIDFNGTENQYSYTDGEHLTKMSARVVTREIAKAIKGNSEDQESSF